MRANICKAISKAAVFSAPVFLVTAFLLLSAAPSAAQFFAPADSEKPVAAAPQDVAMLYYKYAGLVPDFLAWATLTEAYKSSPDFSKASVQEEQAHALEEAYSLIVPGDPIVVNYDAALSDYSLENKGYFVDSFVDGLYVEYTYGNDYYAVVPRDIVENQWLAVEGPAAKKIDDLRLASPDRKTVTITLFLTPLRADKVTTELDGKNYHLLAAEIKNAAIFGRDGQMIWQKGTEQAAQQDPVKDDLMKLYR